jgi:hypothetical protein
VSASINTMSVLLRQEETASPPEGSSICESLCSVNAGRRSNVDGTAMGCEEGRCDMEKTDGGRRSSNSVEGLSTSGRRDVAEIGLRPPTGDGLDAIEEASGDGALVPVACGGESRLPRTFFGSEARRLARAAGSEGLAKGVAGAVALSLLLPEAEAWPAICLYLARTSEESCDVADVSLCSGESPHRFAPLQLPPMLRRSNG